MRICVGNFFVNDLDGGNVQIEEEGGGEYHRFLQNVCAEITNI